MIKDVLILQKRELDSLLQEKYIERENIKLDLSNTLIKVIIGPRRAGKSFFSLHALNKKDKFGYVNFDDEKLIETEDYDEIISAVNSLYGNPKTLFLDEIQKTPQIITCLRYFYEKMPELPVICAGSLLDLALTNINFSIPVGRIEYLYLGPMSFQAFLLAIGKKQLLEFIKNYQLQDELPIAIHQTLIEMLKIYFIVGGLPESVAQYAVNNNFIESQRIKSGLINSYQEDFAKYASVAQQQRMRLVFNKIPQILGEKFKYSNISREDKSTVIKEALNNLVLSRIINKVNHTNANGLPLGAESNEDHFKTYFLDLGLVTSILDLNILNFSSQEDLTIINSGKIAEQFIAQHLLYFHELYEDPKLYYWNREQKGSSAEIDFIVALNGKIIPIEVKAGSSGSLKSLHYFLNEKHLNLGVRFCSQKPSVLQEQRSLSLGGVVKYKLLSLPLYLVEELERFLQKFL